VTQGQGEGVEPESTDVPSSAADDESVAGADRPTPSPGSFGQHASEMPTESEDLEEPADDDEESVPAGDGQAAEDELAVTQMELAERTADLQRLQAEFLNYKRRVDRDRDLIRENATYVALAPITDVLDTIDRARDHAPLEDGFKTVADQLERVVTSLGLTKFGVPGDAFDPSLHEALSHLGEDPDVKVTTCKVVAKAGYRIGDRVVRAAQVLVVDPATDAAEQSAE